MSRTIENPQKFFDELGNLHDARIKHFLWFPEEKRLAVSVDDINSNFAGLPEYQGCQPQTILLEGVREIDLRLEADEDHLNIYEFTVIEKSGDPYLLAEIKCWPGGNIKVRCSSLHLED